MGQENSNYVGGFFPPWWDHKWIRHAYNIHPKLSISYEILLLGKIMCMSCEDPQYTYLAQIRSWYLIWVMLCWLEMFQGIENIPNPSYLPLILLEQNICTWIQPRMEHWCKRISKKVSFYFEQGEGISCGGRTNSNMVEKIQYSLG